MRASKDLHYGISSCSQSLGFSVVLMLQKRSWEMPVVQCCEPLLRHREMPVVQCCEPLLRHGEMPCARPGFVLGKELGS
ncbi:hypothetical protein STEG23_008022, partial [Scotinomys teguina]